MEDEIMTELRRIRYEFAAKHNFDINEMSKAIREFSEAHGLTTVSRERQPVEVTQVEAGVAVDKTQGE